MQARLPHPARGQRAAVVGATSLSSTVLLSSAQGASRFDGSASQRARRLPGYAASPSRPRSSAISVRRTSPRSPASGVLRPDLGDRRRRHAHAQRSGRQAQGARLLQEQHHPLLPAAVAAGARVRARRPAYGPEGRSSGGGSTCCAGSCAARARASRRRRVACSTTSARTAQLDADRRNVRWCRRWSGSSELREAYWIAARTLCRSTARRSESSCSARWRSTSRRRWSSARSRRGRRRNVRQRSRGWSRSAARARAAQRRARPLPAPYSSGTSRRSRCGSEPRSAGGVAPPR